MAPDRDHSVRVPAAPLIEWLEARLERLARDTTVHSEQTRNRPQPAVILAKELGVSRRRLFNYLRGLDSYGQPTDTFRLQRVIEILEAVDVPLYEVYPDLVEVELEPDIWCHRCQEHVTPIDGKCPWHMLYRQRHRERKGLIGVGWIPDDTLHILWAIHRRWRIPIATIAEQSYRRLQYRNAEACERAMRHGFDRLSLSPPATKGRRAA